MSAYSDSLGNGWKDNGFRQVNILTGEWFGLRIYKYPNGKLHYISLLINDKIIGWHDDYNQDGSIDTVSSCHYYK